jgi:dTDP-4-dehydrorhamnose 3,5-epimerase-like enzyme
MNYLYGFASAVFVYWALSYYFPAHDSLLEACIYDDPDIIDSVDYAEKSEADSNGPVSDGEKGYFAATSGQLMNA